MNTDALEDALATERSAREHLDTIAKQSEATTAGLIPLREALAQAEQQLEAAGAAEVLLEGSPDATATARNERSAAREKLAATEAAIRTLTSRHNQATRDWESTRSAATEAAKSVARELAADELARVHLRAHALGESLQRWADLDAAAVGGRVTGEAQQRKLGVADLLVKHGVRVELHVGNAAGYERVPSPEAVLALASTVEPTSLA